VPLILDEAEVNRRMNLPSESGWLVQTCPGSILQAQAVRCFVRDGLFWVHEHDGFRSFCAVVVNLHTPLANSEKNGAAMTQAQQPPMPTPLVPREAQLGALTAAFPVLPKAPKHPRSQPCPGLAARATIPPAGQAPS
jgi:hypothetical protein